MTAEQINFPDVPTGLTTALGSLALPKQPVAPIEAPFRISRLPVELVTEQSGSRKVAVVANLIKDEFLGMDKNLTADQRQEQRALLRASSVRKTFKFFEMIPNDTSVDKSFSEVYEAAEASFATIDRTRLADLAETYENHPAIKVFDGLNASSAVSREDIIFMRRASLLLIDQHSS